MLGLHGTNIYKDIDFYWGYEWNIIYGEGHTVVVCQEECGKERKMLFEKVCFGAAFGISGGGGIIAGLDGEECKPETYEDWFFEAGFNTPYGGWSIDVGIFPFGVVESGPTIGMGGQFGSFCKYTYVGDR